MRLLYPLRLLDGCKQRTRNMGKMAADYVTHRLLHTSLPVHPEWAQIRRIAALLALEDDEQKENYAHYVKILCHRAVDIDDPMMSIACAAEKFPRWDEEWNYDYNLLAAAAYTNKCRIIEQFVNQPPNLRTVGGLFGHPLLCAAEMGHDAALDILFGNFETDRNFLLPYVSARASTRMVKRFMPTEPVYKPKYMPAPTPNVFIYWTPNVETFDMLLELHPEKALKEKDLKTLLEHAASRGWEDLVRHILNMGTSPDDPYGKLLTLAEQTNLYFADCFFKLGSPLMRACERGFESIVRVLLEHKAFRHKEALTTAVKGGNLNVVNLLIEYGANVNEGSPLPIVSAINQERKDIFQALLEQGAALDGENGAKAVESARKEGLTSMLALLEERGVDINESTG